MTILWNPRGSKSRGIKSPVNIFDAFFTIIRSAEDCLIQNEISPIKKNKLKENTMASIILTRKNPVVRKSITMPSVIFGNRRKIGNVRNKWTRLSPKVLAICLKKKYIFLLNGFIRFTDRVPLSISSLNILAHRLEKTPSIVWVIR